MTTITLPRAVAQQMLEALAIAWQQNPHWQITEGMHALRAALAQQAEPVQEPITRLFGTLPVHDTQQALAQQAEPVQVAERERIAAQWDGCVTHQLDAFGPVNIGASIRAGELVEAQQAEPVEPHRWEGDNNIESPFNACMHKSYCMTLKRARVPLAQQAEPVEPFGYWFPDKHQDAVCSGWFVRSPCDGKLDGKPGVPLYTAPPWRFALTEVLGHAGGKRGNNGTPNNR